MLIYIVGRRAKICTGSHNRLLRRQHCSSLCSQSEGHEHVANMTCALGHDFVEFSARAWPPQYSPPSLCEQSELQCFASVFSWILPPNIAEQKNAMSAQMFRSIYHLFKRPLVYVPFLRTLPLLSYSVKAPSRSPSL